MLGAIVALTTVAAAPLASGRCVVAGGFSDEEFPRAARAAGRLQGLGFGQAGVYDGAAFRNFATDLVVIAAWYAEPGGAAAAKEAVARLARKHVGAYAKGCSPIAAPVLALSAPPSRQPGSVAELNPIGGLPAQVQWGCWGWSARRATALCTTGWATWQMGRQWRLHFMGQRDWPDIQLDDDLPYADDPDQRRLTPADRRALEAHLIEGDVAQLGAARGVLPNETLHNGSPRFTVRFERKLDHVAEAQGRWEVWNDRVLMRCERGQPEKELLSDVGSGDAAVLVFVLPDRKHVVLEFSKYRAEEGESGHIVSAAFITIDGGCQVETTP